MFSLKKIKKFFYSNGFIVLKKIFSENEISKLLKEIDKIKKKSIKINNPHLHYTKDKKINTIHNINKYVKSGPILDFSKNKKILKIINYILKSKTRVRNIEFFLKPKKTGMKSPFHQDNYYWNFIDKKAVNLWIACSDSNIKNGGVCYYKHSHKLGLIEHKISYEPGSSQKIPETFLKKIKLKKVYPALKKGDCLIHHCEIIHGSNSNKSNKDRIGLVISYKSLKASIDKTKLALYKKIVEKNIKYLKKVQKYKAI